MTTYFAGLDVSEETTSICVVEKNGAIVLETSAPSTPMAIARILKKFRPLSKAAHETGPFSPWLHKELIRRKVPLICLDARQTRAALAGQRNKTDRNDAKDIATLLSRGFCATVYVKTDAADNVRALLTFRKALAGKARSLYLMLRAVLKNHGATVKPGKALTIAWPRRGRNTALTAAIDPLARAYSALLAEAKTIEALLHDAAKADVVCQRLMTMPGVGPITALTFKAAIDEPHRFASSRLVGAYFGLTPRRFQSGKTSFSGKISKFGDGDVRAMLFLAAQVFLFKSKSTCELRCWALKIKERRGSRLACIALARKMAVVLHRMWVTESDFRQTP